MAAKLPFLEDRGASAVEFALIFPLLLLLTFGIIDGSLLLWRINTAETATQIGARAAIVSDPVAAGLKTYTATGAPFNLPQGRLLTDATGVAIPTEVAVCGVDPNDTTVAKCSCTTSLSSVCSTTDTPAFNFIVEQMRTVLPALQPANVVVEYDYVGLGFAGRPGGAIVPSVTVSIQNFQYSWILLDVLVSLVQVFSGDANSVNPRGDLVLPSFATTLTGEDLASDT